jgi:hypothetical protein
MSAAAQNFTASPSLAFLARDHRLLTAPVVPASETITSSIPTEAQLARWPAGARKTRSRRSAARSAFRGEWSPTSYERTKLI